MMSLPENLQYIRSRHKMTQEQFAEKMGVSRQSVSKWESGDSYPDMDKLIAICDQYQVDLDTLLRGSVKTAYVEDSVGYNEAMNSFSRMIALGVGLVLAGASASMIVEGLVLELGSAYESLSMAALLIFVVAAVTIFIVSGLQHERFCKEHPVLPEGICSEAERKDFQRKYPWLIAGPVAGILLDVVAMLSVAGLPMTERMGCFLTAGFLLVLAFIVPVLVCAGIQQSKFEIQAYNRENDPSPEAQERREKIGRISAVIMLIATAVFLAWGLIWDGWHICWAVYAVGGVLCGIAGVVIKR